LTAYVLLQFSNYINRSIHAQVFNATRC
jgi:hypothetical protein